MTPFFASQNRHKKPDLQDHYKAARMKIVRSITGQFLWDTQRSEALRRKCQIDNIHVWLLDRKNHWNTHITRMTEDQIVKIVRDRLPLGKQNPGRPRKRWMDGMPAMKNGQSKKGQKLKHIFTSPSDIRNSFWSIKEYEFLLQRSFSLSKSRL